ncbi:MAG: nucleotide sugar dehydrogenase [Pseudomonadota bacterium]|nr:nucleotide sugar dehydrogenase [Pseudomonadota bacterium]
MLDLDGCSIGVIGLGYVGLPLAVEFGKQFPTLGFDIDRSRVEELRRGEDRTLEVDSSELQLNSGLRFSADQQDLSLCSVYVVTVPTPIDRHRQPDLGPLRAAASTIAQVLKPGNVVVFESTVYPGATEEVCVPLLEQGSGLTFNRDFFVGYSPERINPGDKQHRLPGIMKVTSGSTPEAADFVDRLYARIITAGTHRAASIKVAEAAKVIENTQRDLNIALINELATIFARLEIDTEDVLAAAGTKWNFLPFKPGLVGGHCISVDPYYLTHKAQELGYHPEVILAGRRINDNMGIYVTERVVKLMTRKRIQVVDSKVLVLGLAFKENCPDIRNTRVIDIIEALQGYNVQVDVYDPWIDPDQAEHEYGIRVHTERPEQTYDAIIIAVAHRQFVDLGANGIHALGKPSHVVFDVKSLLPKEAVDARL